MPLCEKCSASFPNSVIIDGKIRNLQNRKYCLDCSPFNQHNTKNLVNIQRTSTRNVFQLPDDGLRRCARCKEMLAVANFYFNRTGDKLTSYCKACANAQTIKRQQALKRQCVLYKGGKCQRCGYSRYVGALEFHHIDPKQKDFILSHARNTTFEKVKPEIDKCMLVCSNCHRELHAIERGMLQPDEPNDLGQV